MSGWRFPSLAFALSSLALLACSGSVDVVPDGGSSLSTGAGGACPGCAADVPWSRAFRGIESVPATVDGEILAGVTTDDGFIHVQSFGPSGDMVWDRFFFVEGASAQIGPEGRRVLVGSMPATTLDALGTGSSITCASGCVVAAAADASGGVGWVKVYDAASLGAPDGMDVSSIGTVPGTAADGRFAVVARARQAAQRPSVVAELTPSGSVLWSRYLLAEGESDVTGAVLTPAGDLVVAGLMKGALDLGAGPKSSAASPDHGEDGFIARYGPTGEVIFQRHLAAAGDTGVLGISLGLDAAGNILAATTIRGLYDLGAGPEGSAGETVTVLAKLGADGAYVFDQAIAAGAEETAFHARGLAGGTNGDIWLCTAITPGLTFGGQPVGSGGGDAIALLHYDAAGAPIALQSFSGGQDCIAVTLTPSGAPVLAGRISSAIDFGQGPLDATAEGHAWFLAKLAP